MDSKARSKPMRNILERLLAFSENEYEVVIFGDNVILEEDIENWPICDILISFYSRGFPLAKAIDYVKLRKPFCVNDLLMQYTLLDRRLVLLILDSIDVPTPHRIQISRDNGPELPEEVMELVGRDFNIDFSRPLFLQEQNIQIEADLIKTSNKILKKPFVEKPCNGEDHNVYIYYPSDKGGGVRKLFRKVANRSSEFVPDVTEIRQTGSYIYEELINVENQEDVKVYTVGLNYTHAETRKSPTVDGIVRRNADGKEVRYVTLLTEEEQEIARRVCMAFGQTICGFDLLRSGSKSYVIDVNGFSFVKGNEDYYQNCAKILRETFRRAVKKRKPSLSAEPVLVDQWKLKSYISVFRHADRTPKQKVKVVIKSDVLAKYLVDGKDTVVKKKDQITEIRNTISGLVSKDPSLNSPKLEQLIEVLTVRCNHADTKLQLKSIVGSDNRTCFLLIAKWGGEFTHAGRHHSKDLGDNLLKELNMLNKKIVEEVQVFSSSERRALATADVFSKAFIPLAELPADFVKINKELLDDNFTTKEDLDCNRTRITEKISNMSFECSEQNSSSNIIKKFDQTLRSMRSNMQKNFEILDVNNLQRKWCCSETPLLFRERWEKLIREFCDREGEPDIFKVSEIYDSLKYDALHNRTFMEKIFSDEKDPLNFREIYENAKFIFTQIAPSEYGVDNEEKLKIGKKVSSLLLRKIILDLTEAKSSSNCFTRLYFTKESHMYTLLNLILLSTSCNFEVTGNEVIELDYLSQVCFELYEKKSVVGDSHTSKYSIRIGISPGAHNENVFDLTLDSKHSLSVLPRKFFTEYLELNDVLSKWLNMLDS